MEIRVCRQQRMVQTFAALHTGHRSHQEPLPQKRPSPESHHHSLSDMAGYPAQYASGHTTSELHLNNGKYNQQVPESNDALVRTRSSDTCTQLQCMGT